MLGGMGRRRPNVAGGLGDHAMDRRLGITTTGTRDWDQPEPEYNRFESTPYRALEDLYRDYELPPEARMVDYGCGLGRVLFYTHYRFRTPGVGIELHPETYAGALDNLEAYQRKRRRETAAIRFEQDYAETRPIDPAENVFYFFNPFSARVFREVLDQIVESLAAHERVADIVLFYPLDSYRFVLRLEPAFELLQTIELPWGTESLDRFMIWRHTPRTDGAGRGSRGLVL